MEVERKDKWISEAQKTVEADWKPLIVKVIYALFDPEIEDMRRFFEGAVKQYYCIQNEHMTEGYPSPKMLKMYRDTILDEMLGYDLQLVGKVTRRITSTKDFKGVQAWNNFLQTLQETMFDSAGFEFPDSEVFWSDVKNFGYEQAKKVSIERLQKTIKQK